MHLQMQRRLIGYRHKFVTVYRSKSDVIMYCGFSLVDEYIYMQLASGFMQLVAAGRTGATKYIFTIFFEGKMLIAH